MPIPKYINFDFLCPILELKYTESFFSKPLLTDHYNHTYNYKIEYTPGLYSLDYMDPEPMPYSLKTWLSHLKSWKVGGRLKVVFDAYEDRLNQAVFITATIDTEDVRTGNTVPITITKPAPTQTPDVFANSWIRDLLKELYIHELDEQIIINGDRVFDPHMKTEL